ncbi:Bug family tripartite tricarboxylate transporter substrate binding protein [Paracraurococcus lichenis]|uniref:Tripartite tricarboxylate transporter substrate binding protein n=1 Tax=Paracraurococcus lichenis TaxID=3064888 RepID=A0ABT9DXI3_9PROT|nr:tripartite tricarboxylate transporter substrate binding protein [Paracraurococcus sp. LOR1-02]MDO9708612.1 tripartite tricarboxylate transporter substrate binding protein [Paracraurococcus sp. LOR1-02]
MPGRRSILLGAAGLLAAPANVTAPWAQPLAGGRPIRLIVPFTPGGAVDILGRLLAEALPAALGQPVVVENRGGAGGNIGADAVAKAVPDGSTLGVIGVTTLCAAPFLYRSMAFDPQKDLAPVGQVVTGAVLCVVNAQTAAKRGWTDFPALIAWSRAHPEEVRMGSSGTGTTSHLTIEAVNRATGARITHIPYRGGGPAINDLLAGTIDMMFDVMPALMPHVESGAFRALAVSSAQRLPILPEVPGMSEFAALGLGDLDIQSWNAVMAPGGTPGPVAARLHAALGQVAADPAFVERLRPLGYTVATSESPAALATRIRAETPRWRRLVEVSGARLD